MRIMLGVRKVYLPLKNIGLKVIMLVQSEELWRSVLFSLN